MRYRLLLTALAAALSLASAGRAAAMSFERIVGAAECAPRICVSARGVIDQDTYAQFKSFLVANKIEGGVLLVLDSSGGNLLSSLKFGNLVRDRSFSTIVRTGGQCASACVYIFLGGVERTTEKGAKIGVHQPSTVGSDGALSAPDGYFLMSQIAAHVSHLCGNLGLIVPAMRTPPSDMHWLTTNELTRFAVVTPAAVST